MPFYGLNNILFYMDTIDKIIFTLDNLLSPDTSLLSLLSLSMSSSGGGGSKLS